MRKSLFTFAIIFLFSACILYGQSQISSEVNNNISQNNQNQANQNIAVIQTPTEQPTIEQPKTAETDKSREEIQTVADWSKWSAIGTLISAIISVIVLIVIARQ